MQNDIISEIIEVEEKASKIVETAKKESARLINDAQIKANTSLKNAIKEKRTENNLKIDKLRLENNKKIKAYEDSVKNSISVDYKEIDKLSDQIAEKICNSSVFDK